MSIERLRLIDIKEKDEEDMVQEIINTKVAASPPVGDVFRGDVPDIKTPEEEAQWQKVLDEREAAAIPAPVHLPGSEHEMLEQGDDTPPDDYVPDQSTTQTPPEAKKTFCDFCDSKGVRHKKECPTLKVDA